MGASNYSYTSPLTGAKNVRRVFRIGVCRMKGLLVRMSRQKAGEYFDESISSDIPAVVVVTSKRV